MLNNIKHLIISLPILAVALCSTLPVQAKKSSALEDARRLHEATTTAVKDVRQQLPAVRPDSVADMVVMELPSAEEAAETDSAPDTEVNPETTKSGIDKTLLIPIFGIVFGVTVPFATLVMICWLICRSHTSCKRMKYDTIARAAEAGHPLPPIFYATDGPKRKNKLQSGIVWFGWGLAFITLGIFGNDYVWYAIGIIPLFIGISRLAIFGIEMHKKSTEPTDTYASAEDAE